MDTFKWLFLDLGLTNLVFKMWEIWSGCEGRAKGPNTTAAPRQGDVKQKYIANTRFNEVFQNDRSQVITLLKRVKTETVFKHQLPFYKIPIGFFF